VICDLEGGGVPFGPTWPLRRHRQTAAQVSRIEGETVTAPAKPKLLKEHAAQTWRLLSERLGTQ
jgi:hypothetical protein